MGVIDILAIFTTSAVVAGGIGWLHRDMYDQLKHYDASKKRKRVFKKNK